MSKLKKHSVFGLFVFFASILFTSCVSATMIEYDDGSKLIYSYGKITERDISGKNLFIKNLGYSDLNLEIFKMMKSAIADGTSKSTSLNDEMDELNKEIAKKGEIIDCFPYENDEYYAEYGGRTIIIVDSIYDETSKRFRDYSFILTIYDDLYKSYDEVETKLYSYINTCNQNINACNEIIKNCSNPTIQKSRVVKVPYQYWVAGSIGHRTNSSFGSTSGSSGHYETEYIDEIQYYTVPDPNYNPTAVAQAKKDLQYWNNEKDKAYADLMELPLPFILESF